MRSVSRPAALTFLLTVFVLAAIAAVLACGPTAPTPQGEEPKPTAEPTPAPTTTPQLIHVYMHGTLTPIEAPPTPDPNAAVSYSLKQEAKRYLATREAQQAQDQRSVDEPPTYELIIRLNTEDIAGVVETLEAGGAVVHETHGESTRYTATIIANVPVSLMLAIEDEDRITRVETPRPWRLNSDPNKPHQVIRYQQRSKTGMPPTPTPPSAPPCRPRASRDTPGTRRQPA